MGKFVLIEWMASGMGCAYLSDLRFLQDDERERLAKAIEKYPSNVASLWEWNDALAYLVDATPEKTTEEAQNRLVELLLR